MNFRNTSKKFELTLIDDLQQRGVFSEGTLVLKRPTSSLEDCEGWVIHYS